MGRHVDRFQANRRYSTAVIVGQVEYRANVTLRISLSRTISCVYLSFKNRSPSGLSKRWERAVLPVAALRRSSGNVTDVALFPIGL